MTTSTTTRLFHRGYMVSCQPMATDDGRFEARAVVISMDGDKTRSQTFLDLEVCATMELALGRARQAGLEWIDKATAQRRR